MISTSEKPTPNLPQHVNYNWPNFNWSFVRATTQASEKVLHFLREKHVRRRPLVNIGKRYAIRDVRNKRSMYKQLQKTFASDLSSHERNCALFLRQKQHNIWPTAIIYCYKYKWFSLFWKLNRHIVCIPN